MSDFTNTWVARMAAMTEADLVQDFYSLTRLFEECAEGGHGISSKDSIRMNFVSEELVRRGYIVTDYDCRKK